MPTGLVHDPLVPITLPGGNGDLPASQFPSLTRIAVIDLVGPNAANRQHKSLEKRSVSLAQLLNDLIDNSNVTDSNYLRRDGSAQKTNGAGILNDMPMNGYRLSGMGVGAATGNAVEFDQFNTALAAAAAATAAALALKAPLASPALTGNPTAPTPLPGDNDTSIATTAFVTAALAAAAISGARVRLCTEPLVDSGFTVPVIRTGQGFPFLGESPRVPLFISQGGLLFQRSMFRVALNFNTGDWNGYDNAVVETPGAGYYDVAALRLNIWDAPSGGSALSIYQLTHTFRYRVWGGAAFPAWDSTPWSTILVQPMTFGGFNEWGVGGSGNGNGGLRAVDVEIGELPAFVPATAHVSLWFGARSGSSAANNAALSKYYYQ